MPYTTPDQNLQVIADTLTGNNAPDEPSPLVRIANALEQSAEDRPHLARIAEALERIDHEMEMSNGVRF